MKAVLLALALLVAGTLPAAATPTPSRTITPTFTITKTFTSTRTATLTRTPTATRSITRTFTPTRTLTVTKTTTPTPSSTVSPVHTRTSTSSPTVTPTPTITRTFTNTKTPTPAATATPGGGGGVTRAWEGPFLVTVDGSGLLSHTFTLSHPVAAVMGVWGYDTVWNSMAFSYLTTAPYPQSDLIADVFAETGTYIAAQSIDGDQVSLSVGGLGNDNTIKVWIDYLY